MNITLKYIFPLLLVLNLSLLAEDQRIATISKNKSYFCKENTNSILLKSYTPTGQEKNVQELTNKKALTLRKNLVKQIKSLKKELKSETNKKKLKKLEQQIAIKQLVRDGIKNCLEATLTFASDINLSTDPLPVDLILPPTYNETNTITGAFSGSCELKGKHIPAYQAGSDQALFAPQSGQLFCNFTTTDTDYQSLLLKVFRQGSPSEILFTKTINRADIKEDLSFTVALCPEFPGCFNANIIAKAISEDGIDISLEKYPTE